MVWQLNKQLSIKYVSLSNTLYKCILIYIKFQWLIHIIFNVNRWSKEIIHHKVNIASVANITIKYFGMTIKVDTAEFIRSVSRYVAFNTLTTARHKQHIWARDCWQKRNQNLTRKSQLTQSKIRQKSKCRLSTGQFQQIADQICVIYQNYMTIQHLTLRNITLSWAIIDIM